MSKKGHNPTKTKNAELLGLRFPISFFRMKDELDANIAAFGHSYPMQKTFFLLRPLASLMKGSTFASTVPASLPIFSACGYLDQTILSFNDNTPSRLTSVAHLGGFSFLRGI